MLTLQNFETQINETILQRGKQYYKNGAVVYTEETNENNWQAEVDGSDVYSVEIELAPSQEIIDHSCDCPFEGSMCKHVVAVLFALREEVKKNKTTKPKLSKKALFEDLIQKVSLAEFQQFIRQYAAKNKDFKSEFEIYFSEKDTRIDVGKKYTDLVQKMIRLHADRGFVDYRATFKLSAEIDNLLETGYQLIEKNNFKDALILAQVVLKEIMQVVTTCDDSAGNIGGTFSNSIALLEAIAEHQDAAIVLKEQLFLYLDTELQDKIYFDYGDYGYEMFGVFRQLAIQTGNTEAFLKHIDIQLPKLTGKYEDYRRNFFQKQKIDFLQKIGKTAQAQQLIEENLDIVEVRQDVVNEAIVKKDYERAKLLIREGISVALSKEHPGTVSQWHKELLRIAVLEEDTEQVRFYTKLFAFERGFSQEYYRQWKNTYTPNEWATVLDQCIADKIKVVADTQKQKNYWQSSELSSLAPIYIEEQLWDRLLALVKKESHLETLLQYHPHLAKSYPPEMMALYIPALQKFGDAANGRGEYAKLVSYMERIIKDIPTGKEAIKQVAQALKEKYPRRSAMVEELNKILRK